MSFTRLDLCEIEVVGHFIIGLMKSIHQHHHSIDYNWNEGKRLRNFK